MDGKRLGRHVPLRIDIGVKGCASRYPIEQFDAAKLDKPVTLRRIEASRFGIENYFPHWRLCRKRIIVASAL
jgi:hypothetical protein